MPRLTGEIKVPLFQLQAIVSQSVRPGDGATADVVRLEVENGVLIGATLGKWPELKIKGGGHHGSN